MEYTKYKLKNYNLHIIKTDKFKTVNVRINFKRKIKKDEITLRNLLNDLLINTSLNYPTSRDIEIETEELYDLGVSSSPYKSGNYHIMSFKETFLHEKYTEDNMIEKSIEFLLELIFNPNVSNNKFNNEYFNLIKKNVEEDIQSVKDNPTKYSMIRLYEEMDKGPLSYRTAGYLEDLDKITETNLYDYYKSVIENDNIDIFIIGDINNNYQELFDKYIPNTIRKENTLSHYLNLDLNNNKELKETISNNQSKLSIGLRLKELNDFELEYVLSLYSTILGGGTNSKLFKTVREKNSLCYYISSSVSIIAKIITIIAGINKDNYDKAISLIKDEIENMKQGNITEKEIEDAKKIYISGCMEIYDSASSIISNYLSKEYADLDLVEDRIKKIEIYTIFNLEGDIDNEDNSTN